MIIVDTHQDIAYDMLGFGRNYLHSVAETRERELSTDHPARKINGTTTLGLPDALRGNVAIVGATLWSCPADSKGATWVSSSNTVLSGAGLGIKQYASPREAEEIGLSQIACYRRLVEESDRLDLILTQTDLDAVLATWAVGLALEKRRQGLVILMEGADFIVEPADFPAWHERGVRILATSWGRTRYAGGTAAPGPLTDLGRALLAEMAPFNTILDLSHTAEETFYEALERYPGPLMASHSNPRRYRNSDRHLSDDMIEWLAARGGVMGIVPFNGFLSDTWQAGDPKETVPLERVAEVIDYVCQLTGSAAHVGLGTDFDGSFGQEKIPAGLDSIADLGKIAPLLVQRGYSEADVAAIMGGNMVRLLRQSLPAA